MDGAQESAFLCSSRWCRCYWDMNHTYSHWSKGPQKFDSLQYQKITEARSLSGVLFAPSMIEGQTKMEDHDYKIFIQFSSVAQSCPTLCDPMNCSTPGLPVHHQLPEFTQTHVHRVFMGFSRQEYWSGLPFPSPVDHILSDLSTMTRPSWVAPRAWLSFIELDKAVVLVWLDWLVFCD